MNTAPLKGSDAAIRSYRVGDLRVDVGQQRVTRNDVEIHLPKLSFDLFLVLIRAAPDIVSNEDLMARVWPGLVVSPETVSQRIKLLRDALDDDPRGPRYIAGLRNRGYRVIGAVADVAQEAAGVVGATRSEPEAARTVSGADAIAAAPAMPVIPAAPQTVETGVVERVRARRRTHAALALAGVAAAVLLVVWFVSQRHTAVAPTSAPSTVVVEGLSTRSVAVLPFENMSSEGSDDYIGLGLAEMVLNRLSNVPAMLVIARTSSFAFRGKNVDAREIGRQLSAHYLVAGSVQRMGPRLRVSVQLVDTQSGRQFKPMQFDRDFVDLFKVQDEIAERVAAALEVSLGGLDAHRPEQARYAKFDAYLAYLQGRDLLEHWRLADAAPAIERFTQAIAIDPGFAAAHAGLARALYQQLQLQGKDDPAVLERVSALVEKALALDANLGEAYVMRAQLEPDRARAEADYHKGLGLTPSYGAGYSSFAESLAEWNRPQEALDMIDRAILVDPMVPRPYYLKALFVSFRDDGASMAEAEALMMRVLEVDPNFSPALTRLAGWQWDEHGKTADAIKLAERALGLDPGREWIRLQLCLMYLDLGDLRAAQDVTSGPGRAVPSGLIATAAYRGDRRGAGTLVYSLPAAPLHDDAELLAVYAVRDHALESGEYDRAIEYLRRAYNLHRGREIEDVGQSAFVGISLAMLLRKKGEISAARTLTTQLLEVCERTHAARRCSNAHMLAGHRDAALDWLSKAASEGHLFFWWYLVERDPLWADVRSDPRFQAIANSERDGAAHQKALLEQMRAKGEVPLRVSAAAQRTDSPTNSSGSGH